jgi:hypothetical protein
MTTSEIDQSLCPICGEPNACGNLICSGNKQDCWCSNPAQSFKQELLQQVPVEKKGKACICQACATNSSTEIN